MRNNKHDDGKRLAIFIVLKKFLNNSAGVRTVSYIDTRATHDPGIYTTRGALVVKDKLQLLGVPYKNAVKSRS